MEAFIALNVIIIVAGLLGGIVNAWRTDNGFVMPRTEKTVTGDVLRPGYLGNVLVGAVAAWALFALYGPLANVVISGETLEELGKQGITLADIGGALVSGVGGARILTAQVDKQLLKAAAVQAQQGAQDEPRANEIAQAKQPMEILQLTG